MKIEDAVVFVTGASRGIGRAFVEAALDRGARKVYAAMRTPAAWAHPAVEVVRLDVTAQAQARDLADRCRDVTVLVNNAGIAELGGFLADPGGRAVRHHLETNVFGMLYASGAFAPVLGANGGGAILNVLSVVSWFNAPMLGQYCLSKSAAWSLTNGLREELRGQGTQVVGLHMGFVDTDLTRGFDLPKASPRSIVDRAYDGLEAGLEEVLADEMATQVKRSLTAEPPFYLRPQGI